MLPFKTILFATDFSPASSVAFGVASALARDYKARLIALHVIEPVQMGFSEFGAYVGPEEDSGEALARLHAIKAPTTTVALEHRLIDGDPANVIVETAAEAGADVIVMGTHGRTGFTRLIMGSVAEEVLRKAPCPVLTVRGTVDVKATEPARTPETAQV
ncbi:MAG: universal stress protein [Planctomycetes bacterium]|nr:universal stress protein [Planctomycetota bacterium]